VPSSLGTMIIFTIEHANTPANRCLQAEVVQPL